MSSLIWRGCRFNELTASEAYLLLKLRVDVFVVEQFCAYPELDGQDLTDTTYHIFALAEHVPVAYARVLAPEPQAAGTRAAMPVRIGRVVVAPDYRGQGLATQLMQHAMQYGETHYQRHDQCLAAQVEVVGFYASLGFEECSAPYLEDGIAHVDMRRPVNTQLF